MLINCDCCATQTFWQLKALCATCWPCPLKHFCTASVISSFSVTHHEVSQWHAASTDALNSFQEESKVDNLLEKEKRLKYNRVYYISYIMSIISIIQVYCTNTTDTHLVCFHSDFAKVNFIYIMCHTLHWVPRAFLTRGHSYFLTLVLPWQRISEWWRHFTMPPSLRPFYLTDLALIFASCSPLSLNTCPSPAGSTFPVCTVGEMFGEKLKKCWRVFDFMEYFNTKQKHYFNSVSSQIFSLHFIHMNLYIIDYEKCPDVLLYLQGRQA